MSRRRASLDGLAFFGLGRPLKRKRGRPPKQKRADLSQLPWLKGLAFLVLLLALTPTGCVWKSEYTRMQRAMGQEVLALRNRAEGFEKERNKQKQKLLKLQGALKTNAAKLARLQREHKDTRQQLKEQIKQLKSRIQRKEAEIARCGEMVKGRGKQLFDLQGELNKKQQELVKKQEEFRKRQAEFKKKNAELQAELKGKEAELRKKQLAFRQQLKRVRRLEKQVENLQKIYQDLTRRLQGLVNAGKLKIQMVRGMLVLQWPEKILFSTGSARVKREGRRAIQKVTSILKTMNYRWQVVGHTDSTGSARFNWKLSARRALAVLFVMLKAGMPTSQISIAGFGQYQPTAPNDTPANRALNRRTELVLVPDLSELFKQPPANDTPVPAAPTPAPSP